MPEYLKNRETNKLATKLFSCLCRYWRSTSKKKTTWWKLSISNKHFYLKIKRLTRSKNCWSKSRVEVSLSKHWLSLFFSSFKRLSLFFSSFKGCMFILYSLLCLKKIFHTLQKQKIFDLALKENETFTGRLPFYGGEGPETLGTK